MPDTALVALGATLGAIALVATTSARPVHRQWVLPALVAIVLVTSPLAVDLATRSWGTSTIESALLVVAATLTSAAAGVLAHSRLGDVGYLCALAGVAAAMFVGVPDTEAATVMAVALVVHLIAPRLVPEIPISAPAAAVGSAGVLLAGFGGATAGIDGAVGAWGTVVVLAAASAVRRMPAQSFPIVAVLPAVLTVAAVVVARMTASELATRDLLLATCAVVVLTAGVIGLLAPRLPPAPARPTDDPH